MTTVTGQEFNNIATPTPELLLKLANLAAQDSDSVLTGGIKSGRATIGEDRRKADTRLDAATLVLIEIERARREAYESAMVAWEETGEAIDRAQDMTLQRLEKIELIKERMAAERAELGRRAHELADGSLILIDAQGGARYFPDGAIVPDELWRDETIRPEAQIGDRLDRVLDAQATLASIERRVREDQDWLAGARARNEEIGTELRAGADDLTEEEIEARRAESGALGRRAAEMVDGRPDTDSALEAILGAVPAKVAPGAHDRPDQGLAGGFNGASQGQSPVVTPEAPDPAPAAVPALSR